MNTKIGNKVFNFGEKTYIMGILNITPDSFSDGGEFVQIDKAVAMAKNMANWGADILDIGGESTRPGAGKITTQEELARVIPVIKAIRKNLSIPISIDTTKSTVAQAAIQAGANLVNDISAATFDQQMLSTVAQLNAPLILMHIKGTPQTMQQQTNYQDLMAEITEFLANRIQAAIAAGIPADKLIIDPGIGFAKDFGQNIELLRRLADLKKLGTPILVGTSRKSFIGHILNKKQPKERVWGTAATVVAAIANGADILRVHDVAEMVDVSRVADKIYRIYRD
ncbi:MAG: dihydropteroate synthase [Cyanobacteria bacterium J083]|nr:MAG: dihydropteroate synthase [Cyanobacteria bacterium J083]